MRPNWRRGLLRAFLAVAMAGTAYAGLQWGSASSRTEGDCWLRFAKWPDGQPFNVFDLFEEANTPSSVDLNRKKRAWSADSIANRNQWVASARSKLIACETGATAVLPAAKQPVDAWANLKNSLFGFLFPPLAILLASWIVSGFRPSKA